MISSNKHSYAPCYDGNGNVLAMYDMISGHVVSEYEYDPFGKTIRETGYVEDDDGDWDMVSYDLIDNPFRYQTKWNLEVGLPVDESDCYTSFELYDFGKRWYLPEQGQFINRDPIGEAGGMIILVMIPATAYHMSTVTSFESLMCNTWSLEEIFVFVSFLIIGPGKSLSVGKEGQ